MGASLFIGLSEKDLSGEEFVTPHCHGCKSPSALNTGLGCDPGVSMANQLR